MVTARDGIRTDGMCFCAHEGGDEELQGIGEL